MPTTLLTAASAAKLPSTEVFSRAGKTFLREHRGAASAATGSTALIRGGKTFSRSPAIATTASPISAKPTPFVRGGKTFARSFDTAPTSLLAIFENITHEKGTTAPPRPTQTVESPRWETFEVVPSGAPKGSWR
jgi:hypothetical protein